MTYFPADFDTARDRFLAGAQARGAALHRLPIDARGPGGEALGIDIAWLGAPDASRLVVHSSGLHGVEGFAGSAIQAALLAQPPDIPEGAALVLVHVLNPYGMAWLRRVNEANVDLNRSFIRDEVMAPSPQGYRELDALLNPRSPPRADAFRLRAAVLVMRRGLGPLTRAVAEGQYEFPQGLFYGGRGMQPGPAAYVAWLREHLAAGARGMAIDVHTGLGPRGRETLFLRRGTGRLRETAAALVRRVTFDGGDGDAGYRIRGGHGGAYDGSGIAFVTQEFGTYPALAVLHGLREENRWHHHGEGTTEHRSKRRLKELFAPSSKAWRESVVGRGVSLAREACRSVFS